MGDDGDQTSVRGVHQESRLQLELAVGSEGHYRAFYSSCPRRGRDRYVTTVGGPRGVRSSLDHRSHRTSGKCASPEKEPGISVITSCARGSTATRHCHATGDVGDVFAGRRRFVHCVVYRVDADDGIWERLGAVVRTMFFRSDSGPPLRSNTPSNVRRPSITGCPSVVSRKCSRSAG